MGLRARLFGERGVVPADLRAELEADGVVLRLEGLGGTVTYRHYRAPGTRSGLRKVGTWGAIVVTAHRLVVWTTHGREIDVPLPGPLPAGLEAAVEQEGARVCFAYDAEAFHADRSGRVEVRLRTPEAARVVALTRPPS